MSTIYTNVNEPVDIEIEKYRDFRIELQFNSVDDNGVETPMDLTGYSFEMQFRKSVDDVLYTYSIENMSVNGSVLTIWIENSETGMFEFDTCLYDLIMSKNNFIETVMHGRVKVVGTVTRI